MQTGENEGGQQVRQHTVGVVAKALEVLEELIWGDPRTIGELAQATGVEKAAVYRILNTFVDHGYAAKDDEARTYGPGPRLHAAAGALQTASDLVSLAIPHMTALRDEFGETVNLGTLVGQEVRYQHIVESAHSLRMAVDVGVRHPANSTALGKAILAQLGPGAAQIPLTPTPASPRTKHTITDTESLERELERVRARGYAIDDQENELGAVCVAAAIVPDGSSARHAISVSGPATRMTAAMVERIGARLVADCRTIAQMLPRARS